MLRPRLTPMVRERTLPLDRRRPRRLSAGASCLLLCSAGVSVYGLSLMVMTTVTCRAAGRDPSGSRPSTGTIAVRTSPTLWMVRVDAPSEKSGIVFDVRTMVRLSLTAFTTVSVSYTHLRAHETVL